MAEAAQMVRVTEVADVHIHGSAGLVGVGIMNQEDLELIGQLDNSVAAVV